MFALGVVLMLIGTMPVAAGVIGLARVRRLRSGCRLAMTGVIVRRLRNTRDGTWNLVVRYLIRGVPYTIVSKGWDQTVRFRPGQTVTVVCDPSRPHTARLDVDRPSYVGPMLKIGAGAPLLAIGVELSTIALL
ncbi:hypothetical protein BW13_04610 [Bifidobacterium sp. UTCIF-37]|nr:hypothetical protein BW13_04610 [Bifidobacterium sp. UTCIF-37]TPF89931.1 hypothetical protein BW11_04610 [Bifidobacterium sp. UTCIF-38]